MINLPYHSPMRRKPGATKRPAISFIPVTLAVFVLSLMTGLAFGEWAGYTPNPKFLLPTTAVLSLVGTGLVFLIIRLVIWIHAHPAGIIRFTVLVAAMSAMFHLLDPLWQWHGRLSLAFKQAGYSAVGPELAVVIMIFVCFLVFALFRTVVDDMSRLILNLFVHHDRSRVSRVDQQP